MPPKKVSPLWDYYEEQDGDYTRARCLLCSQEVKRGPPGSKRGVCGNKAMMLHLQKAHKETSLEVSESQAALVKEKGDKKAEGDPKNESSRGCSKIYDLRSHEDRAAFLKLVFPEGHPVAAPSKERRKRDLDLGIMFTVILDLKAPYSVARPGFNVLMHIADPAYKLCSENYYWGLLHKIYEQGRRKVKARILADTPANVSICIDGWSHKHTGYLGTIAKWISKDWERVAFCLGCTHCTERHTSANISAKIVEMCEEWGLLDAVEMVCHDNASNMMGMYNINDFPNECIPGRCICHLLQLIIKDCIFDKTHVFVLIKTCREICKKALVSPNFVTDLEQLQKEKRPDIKPLLLHRDVKVRWNSTNDMLERMLLLKDRGLVECLDKPEWAQKFPQKLRDRDWALMENIVGVLKIFHEITEQLSHGSACVSEVIPCATMLLKSLVRTGGQEDQGVVTFKKDLHEAVLTRMGDFELERFYVVSTFLDPRHKASFFRLADTAKTAKQWVVEEVERELASDPPEDNNNVGQEQQQMDETPGTSTSMLSQLRKRIRMEKKQEEIEKGAVVTPLALVDSYLQLPCTEHECLRFWKAYEQAALNCKVKAALLRVAKRFLTPPPSSTDVERLFSYAGMVLEKKRGSMMPDHASEILFVRENLFLLAFQLDW